MTVGDNHGTNWRYLASMGYLGAIKDIVGDDGFKEGFLLPERLVHVSELNIIQRSCPVCGCVITGPDYNVWHIMAAHEVGHAQEARQMGFNFTVEDDGDDDDGGVPI